ncbi:hypothetical protein ASG29_09020 [Sphingomonas sp. Leaf412]|uniref:TonB-dependent receptor n=1 Tax=Sphingomonas sp. Leaf412 TaxID=1736370 RepID=UPI0006F9764D|nr:TonB-dependent receptor [Sphingomonas sp. Leaf412]KQT31994.1 hypothetical protein ASG29_09020 [Sphingomonas sp. Leaf412]
MRYRRWRGALRATAGICLLPAVPAVAQVVTQEQVAEKTPAVNEGPQPAGQPDRVTGRRTYDAAYFAQYAPGSALQMVQRVPGFTIEQVDESVRGFGQAAGNVVVNGQRPAAKSDGVETILGRIPAGRVLRIEVGPGDLFGAEFSGKAQVLNVVTTAGGGVSSTLEGSYRRVFTGAILPEGRASTLVQRGRSTFNLSIDVDNDTSDEAGFDRVTTLPGGVETEYRAKHNFIRDPTATLSGSWGFDDGTNRTAHVNARAALGRFRLAQDNDVSFPSGAVRRDALRQQRRLREYEVGGDVTRPLAGGGLKLIGLATRRRRDSDDLSLFDLSAPRGFEQTLDEDYAETLARIVWNRGDWSGWTVETGFEGVVNRLASRNDLVELATGGGRTRIDLPVDDAVVKEVRGEGFVNVGRALSPTLRFDGGVTLEASRLTVTGDVSAARTLSFLKPRVVLDWRPTPKWRFQLTLQRTVAQLQFSDFISTAELGVERVNGGNAQLVPQRAWEGLAVIEHPILGDGIVRVEAGYQKVQMVQDRVPTPEGFDAPGNLGDGRILILRQRVEAPLTTLGVKGGRLVLYGSIVDTQVRDPYTADLRPFSGNSLFYGEATFRQDLGKFAWGLSLEGGTAGTSYRREETDRRWSDPYASVFAEWRPSARTTVRFDIENLLDGAGYADRRFYDPDRRAPAPFLREQRKRSQHLVPMIGFRQTLG